MPVHGPRFAAWDQAVAPFQEVIPGYPLELEICDGILVDSEPEAPVRFPGRLRPAMAPQIAEVRLKRISDCSPDDMADSSGTDLREPVLRLLLRSVEVVTRRSIDRPVGLLEASNPGIRSAPESEIAALGRALPVRLAPDREPFAVAKIVRTELHGNSSRETSGRP